MTCNGCIYDADGRCRALPPPLRLRVDGGHADRALWPQHDGNGCGGYVAPKPVEAYPDGPNPKRVRLGK